MKRLVAGTLLLLCTWMLPVDAAMAAERQETTVARAQLEAAYPGLLQHQEGERITRLYGRPFGYGDSPEAVAEDFRLTHAEALGVEAPDLVPGGPLFDGRRTQGVMYDRQTGEYKFTLVYYTQQKDGIPVFQADLRLLVLNQADHPLVLAASSLRDLGDFVPVVRVAGIDPVQVVADAAWTAQRTDFSGDPIVSADPDLINFSEPQMVIWAGAGDQKVDPVLAFTFVADNYGSPNALYPERWQFVVDAATGGIVYQEDLIRFTDVSGNVSGMVTPGPKEMSCADEVLTPFPYAEALIVSGNSAFADVNGDFVISNGGTTSVTVQSPVGGQRFDVSTLAGSADLLSQSVVPPGPADFVHNSANTDEYIRAQANGYANANEVRGWALTYNPTYPVIATQTNFAVYVNRNDGYCPGNAWYDGVSLNFCRATTTYGNTSFASVSQHEYGHHLVESAGSGQGEYGEGMSDCISMLIANDPGLGYGFFLNQCSTPLRSADNTCQYSASTCTTNCGSESHDCGRLLSGCVWDTRDELVVTEPVNYLAIVSDLTVNSILVHTGTSITPTITTDFLTLDDDNGDLGDGTPHYDEITTAFAAHNMWSGPPPAHDTCASALPACPGESIAGNTASATNDGASNCGDSNSSPDLWYVYTPATSGSATFSLCSGTSYDSVLSVHSGCPGTAGNDLGCDDDFCAAGGASQVTISVTAGNDYYIRVTGWQGSAGPFNLTVTGPDCAGGALTITFPNGLPEVLEPGTPTSFDVQIIDGTENYVPGTGTLHYSYDGGAFQTAALTSLGGDLYEATLPAAACADTPEFYVSAQGHLGTTVYSPGDAPTTVFAAMVGTVSTLFSDNFQTNQGWTAANLGATSGDWQRGVPVNDPSWAYDPASDSDGSGQCYLTQNQVGNTDVDGGAVELTSPTIDMSTGSITISYDYFLRLTDTAGGVDRLLVQINSNGGAGAWTEIARHNTDGGLTWRHHTITQDDLDAAGVTLTSAMKLRFNTNDADPQSINESGLDAFVVTGMTCVDTTPPTITGAASVVTHTGVGDIGAEMAAGEIHEPRANGVTRLVVTFDMAMDPTTTVPGNVSVAGQLSGAYAGTIGTSLSGGTELTITFDPALADQDRHTVDLSGMRAAGGPEVANPTFEVVALKGDANLSMVTDTVDNSQARVYFGSVAGAATFTFDFNADGQIDVVDNSQRRLYFGNWAP